jgi:predicted GIY-YIG superfamily endonuclease
LSGRGCHYTAWKKTKKLRYSEEQPDRSSALKREAQIKSWPRIKKLALIKGRG